MSGLRAAIVCVLGAGALIACSDDPVPIPSDSRTIELAAFSEPGSLAALRAGAPEVVEVPPADFSTPEIKKVESTAPLADGNTVTSTKTEESALDPATQEEATRVVANTQRASPRVGQRWPVESIIGQINGRPIYADEFFRPIEARLMRLAVSPPEVQAQARMEADRVIQQRFTELINDQLVIAEAQSRLTPEMQQGVLAWLRDMQEQTIAQHGGSRSEAERALREQEGMDVSSFLDQRKNEALAQDLLQRKVNPRVLVSWRDIEHLYEANRAQFAPDPILDIGRIRLSKESQPEQVKKATEMFAEGKSFAEVMQALGLKDEGPWLRVKVGPNGMEVPELSTPELTNAILQLKPGQVSPPVEFRTTVMWLTITKETKPQTVSIFDAGFQQMLRNELYNRRRVFEQSRYLNSLRSRWLTKEIVEMQETLRVMANERYFNPSRR